ncbi:MAG: FkbM family methyltransferase [Roseobacter sp.]
MSNQDHETPNSLSRDDRLDIGRLRLAQCSEGVFMYFPKDLIGRFLTLYGEWSQEETDMLKSLVPPGGVALDVGGNIGWMAVALSNAAGPEGRVYTLEPLEEVYHVLCGNLALNQAVNVVPLRMAAGRARAQVDAPQIVVEDQAFLSATELGGLEKKAHAASGLPDSSVIAVAPIDEIFADLDRVDVIKIDVEGMEPEALAGAHQIITKHKPKLWIEVNKPDVAEQVLPDLRRLGYVPFWHTSKGFRTDNFRKASENIAGTLGDVNVLAVPEAERDAWAHLHEAHNFNEIARLFPGILDDSSSRWSRLKKKIRNAMP